MSNLRAEIYGPTIRCRFCGSWDFVNLCKPLSSIKFYLGSTKMNFPSSISRFFRIFVRLSLHKHDWHTDLSHVFIFQKMFIVFIWSTDDCINCKLVVYWCQSIRQCHSKSQLDILRSLLVIFDHCWHKRILALL